MKFNIKADEKQNYFNGLFLAVFHLSILVAQERIVTGTVTSAADGMPLPGVNVLIEGNTPETSFDPGRAIEQIATQRWVHLYMFGYEAWSEWSKTGYPDDLVLPNGVEIPRRLSYPDNEAFNNRENYNEAVQRQFGGEESIYGTVWWDE